MELVKLKLKNSGNTYKIGDELVFNDAGTTGFGAAGKVSLWMVEELNL